MYKKPMNTILKKLKELGGSALGSLLSLIFTNRTKAVPLYGMVVAPPEQILLNLLPFIGGVFLVLVIAPVVGLIWYRKRGGTKKWPGVIVRILVALFILVLAAFIILLYWLYSQLPPYF